MIRTGVALNSFVFRLNANDGLRHRMENHIGAHKTAKQKQEAKNEFLSRYMGRVMIRMCLCAYAVCVYNKLHFCKYTQFKIYQLKIEITVFFVFKYYLQLLT